jgi:ParB family transcriptional regulator, chromosome partitioning protein
MPKKTPSSLLASVASQPAMRYVPTQDDSVLRLIALPKIQPRLAPDLRELNPAHVLDLAATICATGLLQTITVDSRYRLLAGKHRLAAFRLLAGLRDCGPEIEKRIALFDQILETPGTAERFQEELAALDWAAFDAKHPDGLMPCRLMAFDSEKEPGKALAVEGTENEKRRDFSRAQIEILCTRLKECGYIDATGRPKAGEKALRPALALIIGKSLRHVRRLLQAATPTDDADSKAASALPGLLRALERALPEMQSSRSAKLKKAHAHFCAGLEDLRAYLEKA